MAIDNLQRQRFEHKYRIKEHVALAIRDFVSSYLRVDEYGATLPNLSYPVHSLYFDSPSFKTYQDTINGDRNRYKLRARFYENAPDKPVYFEIKRRFDKVIAKKRAKVHRDAAHLIVAGHLPDPKFLVDQTPEQLDAMEHFSRLQNEIGAVPQVHVAYYREAWMVEGDNSVRVTMDREVKSEPRKTFDLSAEMKNPVTVFGNEIVLELKFTNRFPNWFKDLVQVFGLRRESAAKYVDGIDNYKSNNLLTAYI